MRQVLTRIETGNQFQSEKQKIDRIMKVRLGEGLYTSFVQGWDALVWKCLQHGATSDAI